MHERIITGLMLCIAVIHLLPVTGFLGAERLVSLYNVEIRDGNLEILMRHRAILFGLLGSYIAYGAFAPAHQPAAFLAAFVSMISFLYLALSAEETNTAIFKIVIADVIALICLFVAVGLYALKRYSSSILQ